MEVATNRIIIIVWSWRSKGIGEGVWTLASKAFAGDVVVCWDIIAGTTAMDNLHELVATYERDGSEVMVFLHRQHGYHQAHVSAIVQKASCTRCFLFGEGADPIYLTKEARGLLGTSGTFSAKIDFRGQPIQVSAVADAEQKILYPTHFDFVWQTYQQDIYNKIQTLKEDFFDALGGFLSNNNIPDGALYQHLKRTENRLLLLRLLSFVGRIRKHSNLDEEIRIFERTDLRTLTFENCRLQLATSHGEDAASCYDELHAYILKHVLSGSAATDLVQLRRLFDQLLLLIG